VQSIKDVGWLCDRRTLFKGVHSVNPGHYMTLTSFDMATQHKYWDLEFKDKVGEEALTTTRSGH
jgi:asparagine synthase (glutamine-hydrolysing)